MMSVETSLIVVGAILKNKNQDVKDQTFVAHVDIVIDAIGVMCIVMKTKGRFPKLAIEILHRFPIMFNNLNLFYDMTNYYQVRIKHIYINIFLESLIMRK